MKYQKFEFSQKHQADQLREEMILAGSAVAGPLQFVLETAPGSTPEDAPEVIRSSGFCLDIFGAAEIPAWAQSFEVRPANPLHTFAGHVYDPHYDEDLNHENSGE